MFRRRREPDPEAPDEPEEPEEPDASGQEESVDEAPGWDAIEERLRTVYPDVEPLHMAGKKPVAFGGALDGISAYDAGDHWHLVTFGLTDLYAKSDDHPDDSGWRYELTFRVGPRSVDPPPWAFNLLYQVAALTQDRKEYFAPGHRLESRGPIDGESSPFTCLAFTKDPDLGSMEGPFGFVGFLQIVGISFQELEEMKASSTHAVLERFGATNPKLVTWPTR